MMRKKKRSQKTPLTLRIVDRPLGHRMGFEIHPYGNPDYFAKLSVWEWSRFLDMLLYSAGAIDMDTMHNNVVHVTLLEKQALTRGMDSDEAENLDITEHKVEIRAKRSKKHKVNKMSSSSILVVEYASGHSMR